MFKACNISSFSVVCKACINSIFSFVGVSVSSVNISHVPIVEFTGSSSQIQSSSAIQEVSFVKSEHKVFVVKPV